MALNLITPIKDINKIAAQLAPKFKKLGLETVQDLLFYFPFRYEDYSHLMKIKDLVPNILLTIKGRLELLESRRSKYKKMILVEAIVSDETGKVKVIWFNQRHVIRVLKVGDEVYLSGKPVGTSTLVEFHNPSFEKVNKYDKFMVHTGRLVPIYSSTEKLSQRQIRFLIKRVLGLTGAIQEWLPEEIIKSANLIPLAQAIRLVHFPTHHQQKDQARFRLKFDEIFLIQARAQLTKLELLKVKAQKVEFREKETREFVNNLPFILTQSQKKAAWQIIKDLGHDRPMNRLLEGDVGSGKTIAAGVAILNALLAGCQIAYMAPTEILAHQQFVSFVDIFSSYNFSIGLLTRSETKIVFKKQETRNKKQKITNNQDTITKKNTSYQLLDIKKSDLIKMIAAGEVDLVIGTHALIHEKVNFKNLNFVIVDEQHRFGVEQRKALRDKARSSSVTNENSQTFPPSSRKKAGLRRTGANSFAYYPHLLSMTATPIPRSLALTLYGDLDLSVIDEMPKDRKSIQTKVIQPHERQDAYDFIRAQINSGRQVFVICPLIDPSDKLGVKAVTEEFKKLDEKIFKDIKIGLLHGKLKSKDKEKIMQEFVENKIKILVSTCVVEVGIDVPNATVMMIESAERFGLAQLHQLRGRVGRAEHQSYCFLFTESDAGSVLKRMQALVQCKNGFELAEKDLEFRGPGEVYGVKQSGYFDSLKIAKLTDWPVIQAVKLEIEKLFKQDPSLNAWPQIKEKIRDFETSVHFE